LISSRLESIGDPMPVNNTSPSQPSTASAGPAPARTAAEAWQAWVMTPRNSEAELDRWREYYALAVPRHDPEAGQ
jgi:hypothetical protein